MSVEPREIPKSLSKRNDVDFQAENQDKTEIENEKIKDRILILEARLQVQYDLVARLRAEITEMREENIELQMIIEDIPGSCSEQKLRTYPIPLFPGWSFSKR